MIVNRRNLLLGGLSLSVLGAGRCIAGAQDYPTPGRSIKVVVPAVAGGGLDIAARLLVRGMSDIWKQPAYVENRPGANWTIGMNAVAKSEPDGYTLLSVSIASLSVNPFVLPKSPFDPFTDLTPITNITRGTFVLALNPTVPAKSLAEFIAYLKANPGKLNHGASSASTILLSEFFKSAAGVDFTNVNYRGGAQVVQDTIAGTVQFCFSDIGSALSGIQSGQLRAIGVTASAPYDLLPDIPIMSNQLPGFVMQGGVLLIAPAKTPPTIINKLHGLVKRELGKPDVGPFLKATGNLPGGSSPEEIQEAVRTEAARWSKLIKERNIHF